MADIGRRTVLFTGLLDGHGTGREKFRYNNLAALRQIVPDLPVFSFVYNKEKQAAKLLSLRLDGLHLIDRPEFAEFVSNIPEGGIAFFDGSNYGTAVAKLRGLRPDVRTIVLYHNVESSFFYRAFRQGRRPKSLALAAYYYLQERMVVKHAQLNVFLTKEDAHTAKQFYSRMEHTAVLPISVDCAGPVAPNTAAGTPLQVLFVGGAFYANIEAALWLQEALAGHPQVAVTVVGKGFDRIEGLGSDNVRVLGFVDSLADYYNASDIVTNPIFSGSGMKTKVAEALYYGKPVLSTRMGINGYDEVADREYIHVFEDKKDFLRLIESMIDKKRAGRLTTIYPQARHDYTAYYSKQAHIDNLARILRLA